MKMRYSLLVLSLVGLFATKGLAQGYTEQGAVIGGLGGALAGAAIGKHNGETAAGALLGGAVGLIAGSAIGDAKDREANRQQAYYQQQAYVASRAVSPQQVVTMTQSGVDPQVIITQIRQNGVTYRLQVNDVIALHQQGVHEAVINAMQNAPLATAMVAPAPTYSRPVVVQEHYHYAPPPVYYRTYHHHHGHYHRHRSGSHWGISIHGH